MEREIIKIKNIIGSSLIEDIDVFIESIFTNPESKILSSFNSWNKGLIKNSTPVLRYVLDKSDLNIYNLIKKEVEKKVNYKVGNIMIYFWPNLSYIGWHNDLPHDAGLTIFMNKKWDINWGGFFLYEDGEEIKAVSPERNLGVLQIGGVNHAVSTINYGADIRTTIQIFFRDEKKSFI